MKEHKVSKKELFCWDCKRKLKENEEYMTYKDEFIKCKACHIADPILRNFQKTEVYSRVVGYIRPVSQWNPGKKAEYEDRVEFDISN
jgi:anaerobic ribonucleoside-triphosphate reductase